MKITRFFLLVFCLGILAGDSVFAGGDKEEMTQVQGVVLDENGEPLAGVAVRVQGVSGIFYTNFDGQFEIPFPKNGKANLFLSYVTYKDKVILLESKQSSNSDGVTITLESTGQN